MPVIGAVGIARSVRGREKREPPEKLPFRAEARAARAPSRDGCATRCALHLSGVETAGAHLHLRDLAIDHDAGDLEVRLPGAARLVVRVGDVVPERDSLATAVADAAIDGHGRQPSMSSMRAISAPSPLRWPVLRMRVYPPGRCA